MSRNSSRFCLELLGFSFDFPVVVLWCCIGLAYYSSCRFAPRAAEAAGPSPGAGAAAEGGTTAGAAGAPAAGGAAGGASTAAGFARIC